MKILVVLGTRPEAIKLAPLVKTLSARPGFECRVCVTGQHREMLRQVFDLFEIQPDWDLDLMRPNQDLAYLTGAALSGIGEILRFWRPDRVIVQGDTTSTLAGAMAAFYHRVPVAHIEAGLRTGNLYAPWPEEANRKMVTQLADRHFAPTAGARDNLLREGIPDQQIEVTGNTGIDALLWVASLLDRRADLRGRMEALIAGRLEGRRLILMTGHRRENFEGGLQRTFNAMAQIAERPDVIIVFPVHPNPNVREVLEPLRKSERVLLIEPLDYPDFVFLLKRCYMVVTDSGGIQEEAPSLGKPVLVTRDLTERPEAIVAGSARLVGTDERRLLDSVGELLDDTSIYHRMSRVRTPYGDGHASSRIATRLATDAIAAALMPAS
jgi:UDP-N-acetylglucosamine 2-epimerase (non-hydrolysing)